MSSSATIERLAELAVVRDEDLAAETRTPQARALLSRILEIELDASPPTPSRRKRPLPRRRWLAIPAIAVAIAASVVAVLVSGGGSDTAGAAAATLRKAASVAGLQTPLVPGPGEFLYTKSVNAYTNTVVPVGGAATAYTYLVSHVREAWLGPNGGRLYETTSNPRFLTAKDRERWIAAGRPNLTEGPSQNKLPPTQPLDLPSDPEALYTRLKQDARGHGAGLYREMFTLIGDSLRETAATPAQRAALYQVAARIPGVELVGTVKDSAGRPGVAVTMSDHGIRFTLIFDPNTSALLGEEQVALEGNSYGYAPGTRVGSATYLVQKIVDSDTATQ